MLYTIQTMHDILITIQAHGIRMLYFRIEQQKDRPGSVSYPCWIRSESSFDRATQNRTVSFRSGAERQNRTVSIPRRTQKTQNQKIFPEKSQKGIRSACFA